MSDTHWNARRPSKSNMKKEDVRGTLLSEFGAYLGSKAAGQLNNMCQICDCIPDDEENAAPYLRCLQCPEKERFGFNVCIHTIN